jgi:hypothetical protein
MGWNTGLTLAGVAVGLAACGGGQKGAAGAQASGAQVAATAQASVGPQDPNNILIGQWRFSGIGSDSSAAPGGCATAITFTSTQQTMTSLGATSTIPVTYNASPTGVFVLTDAGIDAHVTYNVLDANHVQLDSWPACTFTRVG